MLNSLIKQHIEFLRLDTPEARTFVAKHYLGEMLPNGHVMIKGEKKQRWKYTTEDDFFETFGVSLQEYPRFYAEVGGVDTPEGPVVPGTVGPIFMLKETNSGRFKVHMFKLKGYYSEDRNRAWIDLYTWAEAIGDNELLDMAKRAEEVSKIEDENREQAEKELRAMMGIVEDEQESEDSKSVK